MFFLRFFREHVIGYQGVKRHCKLILEYQPASQAVPFKTCQYSMDVECPINTVTVQTLSWEYMHSHVHVPQVPPWLVTLNHNVTPSTASPQCSQETNYPVSQVPVTLVFIW